MTMGAKSIALAIAVAGFALAGVTAPAANAHGADAVVRDLESEGYLVQINWLNGQNGQQMSYCTVVRVNNPSSSEPNPGDTVYVDITCPNNLY